MRSGGGNDEFVVKSSHTGSAIAQCGQQSSLYTLIDTNAHQPSTSGP